MTPTLAAPPELVPLDAVATRLAGPDADTMSALATLVDDPRAVAAWLGSLDTAEQATAIANRSYWHANGFAKLVLHVGAGFRLRLHAWPPGQDRRGESNPHGHRWRFASTVLCGEGLRATHYAEAAGGMSYVRYLYGGGRDVGMLSPAGNATLVTTDVADVRAHDRYAVTTDTVHTVDPLGTSLVATLVVQGAPRVESTVVYCAPGQDADQPGRPIRPEDVRQLLRAVVVASGRVARG